MLLITIPDQYPNYYKALEICTGYFDSLDIMILFSYLSSIVITRDNFYYSAHMAYVVHIRKKKVHSFRTEPTLPVTVNSQGQHTRSPSGDACAVLTHACPQNTSLFVRKSIEHGNVLSRGDLSTSPLLYSM